MVEKIPGIGIMVEKLDDHIKTDKKSKKHWVKLGLKRAIFLFKGKRGIA